MRKQILRENKDRDMQKKKGEHANKSTKYIKTCMISLCLTGWRKKNIFPHLRVHEFNESLQTTFESTRQFI